MTRIPLEPLWGQPESHVSLHTHPRGRATLTSCPTGAPWAVGGPGGAVDRVRDGGPGLQQAGGRRGDRTAHPEVFEGAELLVALETGLEAIAEDPRAGYAGGGEGDLVPAQPLRVWGHGGTAPDPVGETPKMAAKASPRGRGRGCEEEAGLTLGRANRKRAGREVAPPTRRAPALSKPQPSTAQPSAAANRSARGAARLSQSRPVLGAGVGSTASQSKWSFGGASPPLTGRSGACWEL